MNHNCYDQASQRALSGSDFGRSFQVLDVFALLARPRTAAVDQLELLIIAEVDLQRSSFLSFEVTSSQVTFHELSCRHLASQEGSYAEN